MKQLVSHWVILSEKFTYLNRKNRITKGKKGVGIGTTFNFLLI